MKMSSPILTSKKEMQAGLCGSCSHARRMQSDRGSVFIRCELSFADSRFVKYPRLPVLSCTGYEGKNSLSTDEQL